MASAGEMTGSASCSRNVGVGIVTVRVTGECARFIVVEDGPQVALGERPLDVDHGKQFVESGNKTGTVALLSQPLEGYGDDGLRPAADLLLQRLLGTEVREPL